MRVLAVLLLPAMPVLAAPSPMVGSWFGSGQPGDKSSMYIDRMRADGSWRGEYRTCVKGKTQDVVQEGRWALSGDILTLTVQIVDGNFLPRIDTYRMLQIGPTAQKYVELPMNFTYTPKRVADSFTMPRCDLVS